MPRATKPQPYEPEKCWVGDKHKICYPDKETAEASARLVEFEHGRSSILLQLTNVNTATIDILPTKNKTRISGSLG